MNTKEVLVSTLKTIHDIETSNKRITEIIIKVASKLPSSIATRDMFIPIRLKNQKEGCTYGAKTIY